MLTIQIEKFRYQATGNSPVGYSIEVYRGGFESADGGSIDLQAGIHTGIVG